VKAAAAKKVDLEKELLRAVAALYKSGPLLRGRLISMMARGRSIEGDYSPVIGKSERYWNFYC